MKRDLRPLPYRLARVYIGPKESFVEYYFYSLKTARYVRDKVRLGQRNLSQAEKRAMLRAMCYDINVILKERNKQYQYHEELTGQKDFPAQFMSVVDGMTFVKDSGDEDLSESRISSIAETIFAFERFLKVNPPLRSIGMHEVSDAFLKLFRKFVKGEGKAGKTVNKYLHTFQFCSEWMARNKMIPQGFRTVHLRVAQPKK